MIPQEVRVDELAKYVFDLSRANSLTRVDLIPSIPESLTLTPEYPGAIPLFVYSSTENSSPIVLFDDIRVDLFGSYSQDNTIHVSSFSDNAVLAFDEIPIIRRLSLLKPDSIIRVFASENPPYSYPNGIIEVYYKV
jgi:hypothetical protein